MQKIKKRVRKTNKPRSQISTRFVIAVGALVAVSAVVMANLSKFKGNVQNNPQVLSATTTEFVINQNAAIANQDANVFVTGQEKMWIGTGQSRTQSFLGLHFSGGSIPAGAEIESATLEVTAVGSWISTQFSIYGDTSDSKTFSSNSKPGNRTLTTSSKDVSENVKWEANQKYTYDVTAPVRELIGSNGANDIGLIVKGTGSSWGRKEIYGRPSTSKSPKLRVVYITSSDNDQTPPVVDPTSEPSSTSAPTPTPTPTTTPTPTPTVTPTSTPTPLPTIIPTSLPTGHTGGNGNDSHAMAIWTPTSQDTCTKDIHDKYSVVVDGKRFPTWHPPIDPETGCTFGHEHGRDPAGSDLMPFIREYYGTQGNALPFGLANEKLDEWNAVNNINNGMRHEDHVGHKIEWENNVELRRNKCANTPASQGCYEFVQIGVQCDFLMKVHQGTHSKDAFTNNLHELQYFVDCTDGTKIASTKMVAFGKPGEFTSNNKNTVIRLGGANPANSPSGNGTRFIPTIDGVKEHILVLPGQWSLFSNGLYEDWLSSNYLYNTAGKQLAYFDPHFAVFGPSRYYDPSKPDNVGRTIDVCFMTDMLGLKRARGGECDRVTPGMKYDDPRSPFNGVKREFYFNQTSIDNNGGPTVWYTDPFGKGGKTTPFAGAVKHYIAPVNNERGYAVESHAIGGNRYYGGRGVHAPN